MGLAWGLGELFLRRLPFAFLWAGVELSPTMAIMGTKAVVNTQDAGFLFAARLAVLVWHGAIMVLMTFGFRRGILWPVALGIGVYLIGNAISLPGEYAFAPYVASFRFERIDRAVMLFSARAVTRRALRAATVTADTPPQTCGRHNGTMTEPFSCEG